MKRQHIDTLHIPQAAGEIGNRGDVRRSIGNPGNPRRIACKQFVIFWCPQEPNNAKFDDEIVDNLLCLTLGQSAFGEIAFERCPQLDRWVRAARVGKVKSAFCCLLALDSSAPLSMVRPGLSVAHLYDLPVSRKARKVYLEANRPLWTQMGAAFP